MATESRVAGFHSVDAPARVLDRDDILAAIRSHLLAEEGRLLTLTRPGGVGKTRLALEIGGEAHSHFPHDMVFVDLCGRGDALAGDARAE
jgi:hypothetical protein